MKNTYFHTHQKCKNCKYQFNCVLSPNFRYHPSRIHFVFFPELVVESSFPELFPELSFYP
jgi:hypothetical protein